MASQPTYRVVVAGGGFGGLYAARALARRSLLGGLRITLVDRSDDFVFKPLLYELLTGEIAERDVALPYADLLLGTGIEHLRGEVGGIDLRRRRVDLTGGPALAFDAAVLALGSEPHFRGKEGLADFAFTASSLEDFRKLVRHFAALGPSPDDLRARTVAVCGAGASGVEIAAKLADRARRASPGAPWRIVLIEASLSILPGFGEEVKARARALLAGKGVELRLGTPVEGEDGHGLLLGAASNGDGRARERLPAATVIWTAGQRPSAVIRGLPVPHDETGRILVTGTLELPDHPGVFALGDDARSAVEGDEAPPATAQVAVQQSTTVARNILARRDGMTLASFRYFPLAETLSVGRGYDIFSVLGVTLEGRPAHVVRRMAYLLRMPGGLGQKAWAGARFGARLLGEALGEAADGVWERWGGGGAGG